MTRVSGHLSGHTLLGEGAAYNEHGSRIGYQGTGGPGMAKCSCGALSPFVISGMKRKQWHRDHKAAIRAEAGQ